MADQAVVENLTRNRARAMQDRAETTQNERAAKRHWRIPELAVGLVLMLGGALGSILLSRSGDSIVVIVGSARDIERGSKLEIQDLVAIETPKSLSGSFISQSQTEFLLGQTLLVDVEASTPLTLAMLSSQQQLSATEALTSAAVQFGNYPADLAVGDQVRVITLPDIALSQISQASMFDQVVTIWSFKKASDSNDSALVTFRSSLDLSMAVAQAGEVHIVRVASSSNVSTPAESDS